MANGLSDGTLLEDFIFIMVLRSPCLSIDEMHKSSLLLLFYCSLWVHFNVYCWVTRDENWCFWIQCYQTFVSVFFHLFSNKLYACCSALLPHKLVLQHPIPGFSAKKLLLSKLKCASNVGTIYSKNWTKSVSLENLKFFKLILVK